MKKYKKILKLLKSITNKNNASIHGQNILHNDRDFSKFYLS